MLDQGGHGDTFPGKAFARPSAEYAVTSSLHAHQLGPNIILDNAGRYVAITLPGSASGWAVPGRTNGGDSIRGARRLGLAFPARTKRFFAMG
jgi:hypothetical protein